MMTSKSKERLTQADLDQFTGDSVRYRHVLNPRVNFTPGVHFLAESADAFWLIDAIASYYGTPAMKEAIQRNRNLAYLQFWRLTVTGESAVLTARADEGVEPFVTQSIEFTDFSMDSVEI